MISIVILTHNSRNFINPCLDSVFGQNYRDFEVIIVDNGSKDETVDIIKKDYPSFNLIENKENLGAARARNQGIEIAEGEWILTLDCDTVLEKDFFLQASSVIQKISGKIGMIQPKILNIDKEKIYSCGIYLSKLRRFYDIGRGEIDNGKFKNSEYIFGPCSAAALYKRQMLDDIKENTGFFDERFFFLVEDVDLAWRANNSGWRVIFLPNIVCFHSGNGSATNEKLRQFLCFRNRHSMLNKNETFFNRIVLYIISAPYELGRFVYLFIFNKYLRDSMWQNKHFALD